MNDPFALWRNKDPLTLREAGALICDVPPSRRYPHTVQAMTQELRDERGQVEAAVSQLLADAEAGSLRAALQRKREGGERVGGWLAREYQQPSYSPVREWTDPKTSTVARADLESWCSQRGLSPAIFKPLAGLASPEVGNAQDQELNTRSRRTALAIIAALADLGELDLSNPLASGGIGEQVAGKIEARLGKKVSARTVADYLRDARDLPREDCS